MERPFKKLVFENGRTFCGTGFGANVQRIGEVVFNTSMVGYQEIYSNPSYSGQMVCMTYPLIGNYGMAAEDYESYSPSLGALIVREYNDSLANFRAAKTLSEEMQDVGIPGIEGVDTRSITRMIRQQGSMRAILCDACVENRQALATLNATPPPYSQVKSVSCQKRWYARSAGVRHSVVVIDCGVKQSIINGLLRRHCNITVVPYRTTAEEVLALAPCGVLVSNGPGNPEDVGEVVALLKELQGKLPIFGICLGHLLIALANGCQTYKLKVGHCGGNHPVRNNQTGQITITSQHHLYAVEPASAEASPLTVTHTNLLDHTVEGLASREKMVFGVQYHPESQPGPQGSSHLFDQFVHLMEEHQKQGGNGNIYL